MSRVFLLLIITATLVAAVLFVPRIGWDSLAQHQEWLRAWVTVHPIAAAGLFLGLYILTTALSLPHGALMTVAGGLLFGTVYGYVLTVIGATVGATLLLVIIQATFAKIAARHRHRIPEQVRLHLARDGFSYLLALRLVPLFPFWIVNLAAAIAGLRIVVFVPATLLGITPVSLLLSYIGSGISSVLSAGGTPDLSVIFAPRILLPLLALSALSLVPALIRRRSGLHA